MSKKRGSMDDIRDTKTFEQLNLKDRPQFERMAWGIVLISFALFCLICAGSTLGIYHFFFLSSEALPSTLEVGRGTVVIVGSDLNERNVRTRTDFVEPSSTMSTDSQSQATVTFTNVDNDLTHFVSAVTLKNESVMRFNYGLEPRFDWSQGGYRILMDSVEGEIDLLVAANLPRSVSVQLITKQGARIDVVEAGRYTVTARNDEVRLIVRDGVAFLFARNNVDARLVTGGQEAVIYANQAEPVILREPRINLLKSGLFSLHIPFDIEDTVVQPTGGWGCANNQEALPRGSYRPDVWEGRTGLRLIRGDGADANGETRCKHPFASPGWDVRSFTFLEMEATLLVNYQSLNKCGIRGSECPLMLHIEYVDVNGDKRDWFQGFYTSSNPQFDDPSLCESCIQEHRQINEKSWFTYNSGNLFTILANTGRPAYISNVEFYASGHEYDVFVSEVALTAGLGQVVPPSSGSTVNN